MPKYVGTYTLEYTLQLTAPDLNTAQQQLRAHVSLQAYPTKVLSVIRKDPPVDMEKGCPACAEDRALRQITWAKPTPQDPSAA